MELPTYVSLDEARAACDRRRIRDWTQLRDPVVEVEGDVLKALEQDDNAKVTRTYTSLVKARARLAAKELVRAT